MGGSSKNSKFDPKFEFGLNSKKAFLKIFIDRMFKIAYDNEFWLFYTLEEMHLTWVFPFVLFFFVDSIPNYSLMGF